MSVRSILAVPGLEHTSPEVKRAVVRAADALGMNPDHLATVISFETAGKWTPDVKNPYSGATGAIQFMPATAKRLGTSTSELAAMSLPAQIEGPVVRYFQGWKRPLTTLEDVYAAVFLPVLMGKSDDYVVGREDEAIYEQNKGFDSGKKGYITRGDVLSTIRARANAAHGNRIDIEMDEAPAVLPVATSLGGASVADVDPVKLLQRALTAMRPVVGAAFEPADWSEANDVDGIRGPRTEAALASVAKFLGVSLAAAPSAVVAAAGGAVATVAAAHPQAKKAAGVVAGGLAGWLFWRIVRRLVLPV